MSSLSIANYFPFRRVKVIGQSVSQIDSEFALVQVEPDRRFRSVCHVCGAQAASVHGWTQRQVRDLNFGPAEVWVQCRYRKIACSQCDRIRVEDLELLDPCKRVTKRLARTIHELCKVMTVTDVAKHFGLDWKTVKDIDKAFLQQQYGQTDYTGLRILAVDEIAVRKGHHYMTVVIDYETGRVVWMGRDRTRKSFSAFFASMSQEQKEGIEAIAMDMWEPYIKCAKEHIPQARIVFDMFHVVAAFNKVIDRVRIDEYKKASQEDKPVYKGTKYLLLTNTENLSDGDRRRRLKALLALNETISTVMILKEELKRIWRYKSRYWARRRLHQWCQLAATLEHPALQKFIAMLQRHQEGILNHCDYPIHTSKLEGINNKIKVIKRDAYGYRDQRYFTLKVLQAFDPRATN